MKKFVVVTGLPASGKSLLGRAIASHLRLPLIDKDAYLERLFESEDCFGLEARQMLSRKADRSFREEAEKAQGAVLVSWWKHPNSNSTSGTPTDWLTSLPGTVVELRCICPPKVAVERFIARNRHPGHRDSERSTAKLLAQFKQHELLGALGIGAVVECGTEASINLDIVLEQLTAAFAAI